MIVKWISLSAGVSIPTVRMNMPKAGMSGVRRRKARQPGKPKRASSAYFYFLSHLREEMKQQGARASYRYDPVCRAVGASVVGPS